MSEILTIDLKELEEKVENGEGLNHKEAVVLLEFVRKIISNGGAVPQPQLTIPKSIADELDSVFAGIDATDIGYVLDQTGPYGSRVFNDYYFKNKNIIALYLAGKALGVDLVKVVEND